MQRVTGARTRVYVVVGIQHEPARVLSRLHVPQDAARRQPSAARHTGYGQQRELTIFIKYFHFTFVKSKRKCNIFVLAT